MTCEIGDDVERAASLLRAGKLVAFATETVYGLGANAFDTAAVASVFRVKQRPLFDPLILHVAHQNWLPRLVRELPTAAERLANAFWPGPLTLVLPKNESVPDLVTAGMPSVAVRIPSHPLALALLTAVDLPIAAPSANLFGRLSPTTAAHVAESLGDRIDYILDGGPCVIGVESTVLQINSDTISLLRPGGISREAVEALVGQVTVPSRNIPHDTPAPAPGMLSQHYAPRTPLTLIDDVDEIRFVAKLGRVGLLAFSKEFPLPVCDAIEILSATGNLTEAAANLYAALRRLDQSGVDRIYAVRLPQHGLGSAINDRLERAATGMKD